MQYYDGRRVQVAAVFRRLCGDTEAQSNIVHVVDDNASILWSVFCNLSQNSLSDMVAVKEGHLCGGFDPHFVLAILCDVVQAGNVQLKLARLCELAKAGAYCQKIFSTDVSGKL